MKAIVKMELMLETSLFLFSLVFLSEGKCSTFCLKVSVQHSTLEELFVSGFRGNAAA